MALFKRKKDGIHDAAHVKGHTLGTSNEVSFSVLDAAREEADAANASGGGHKLGRISLFSLPHLKKPISTPKKDEGIHLSSGEFIPASGESSAAANALAAASLGADDGGLAVQVESSDDISSKRRSDDYSSKSATGAKGDAKSPLFNRSSYDSEVSRRKTKRKRSRVLTVVAVVAVCAVLVCAGGFAIRSTLVSGSEQSGTVRGALQSVVKADKVLFELDALLASEISEESLNSIDRVSAEIPNAQKQLEEALKVVQAAAGDSQTNADKEAANNAISSIEARLEMFESGQELLDLAKNAIAAIGYIDDAWTMVMDADTTARLAADMVSKSTESATISAAREKAAEALVEMRSALTLVYDAQKLFPDADLAATIAYLEKRIEALEHAVNAIQAIIDEDPDRATSENEAYNTADAEAATLAKDLSDKPSQKIYEAYASVAAPYVEAYESARNQAGISDQPLRSYLSKS